MINKLNVVLQHLHQNPHEKFLNANVNIIYKSHF